MVVSDNRFAKVKELKENNHNDNYYFTNYDTKFSHDILCILNTPLFINVNEPLQLMDISVQVFRDIEKLTLVVILLKVAQCQQGVFHEH